MSTKEIGKGLGVVFYPKDWDNGLLLSAQDLRKMYVKSQKMDKESKIAFNLLLEIVEFKFERKSKECILGSVFWSEKNTTASILDHEETVWCIASQKGVRLFTEKGGLVFAGCWSNILPAVRFEKRLLVTVTGPFHSSLLRFAHTVVLSSDDYGRINCSAPDPARDEDIPSVVVPEGTVFYGHKGTLVSVLIEDNVPTVRSIDEYYGV